MSGKKYLISYDWKMNLNGQYCYYEHYETDSFIKAVLKFLMLKRKHEIMTIEYRDYKE